MKVKSEFHKDMKLSSVADSLDRNCFADFHYIFGLIIVEIVMIGIIGMIANYKLLKTKWYDIVLMILPFGAYCLIILLISGAVFPVSGMEDDYGRGIALFFGIAGSWFSIQYIVEKKLNLLTP